MDGSPAARSLAAKGGREIVKKYLGRQGSPSCSMVDYPAPGLIFQNPKEK
jgi:hypothetical protein